MGDLSTALQQLADTTTELNARAEKLISARAAQDEADRRLDQARKAWLEKDTEATRKKVADEQGWLGDRITKTNDARTAFDAAGAAWSAAFGAYMAAIAATFASAVR